MSLDHALRERQRLPHATVISECTRHRPGNVNIGGGIELEGVTELQRTTCRLRSRRRIPQVAPEGHLLRRDLHQRLELHERVCGLLEIKRNAACEGAGCRFDCG